MNLGDWLHSTQGIVASVLAGIGSALALASQGKRFYGAFRRLWTRLSYLLNLEVPMKEMSGRLSAIERGLRNVIEVRRALMAKDQVAAHFEADTHGRFEWSNRLWQTMTGLDSSATKGHGWESGVDEPDRIRVMASWQLAVDHQRDFEELTFLNNRNGTRTKVRLTATPIRDVDGTILSYIGSAIKES